MTQRGSGTRGEHSAQLLGILGSQGKGWWGEPLKPPLDPWSFHMAHADKFTCVGSFENGILPPAFTTGTAPWGEECTHTDPYLAGAQLGYTGPCLQPWFLLLLLLTKQHGTHSGGLSSTLAP